MNHLTVQWTDIAEETFLIIINLLENSWGVPSAEKFVQITHSKINLISTQPYLYKASVSENIRQAIITKQTSLLYEIIDDRIVILFFMDNRQQPII